MTRLVTAAVVFALFAGVTLLLLRPRDTRVAPVGPYEPLVTTPAAVPALRAALGTSACTSSGCHAGTLGEGEPWRSAYSVWALHDPHSRAERVLHGALAAQIVAGIAAVDPPLPIVPAPENRACTGCHAPLAAPHLRRSGPGAAARRLPAGDTSLGAGDARCGGLVDR